MNTEKLEELNNYSVEYYSKVKEIYYIMKEQLIKNITEINGLIIACEKVTYQVQGKLLNEIMLKIHKILRKQK